MSMAVYKYIVNISISIICLLVACWSIHFYNKYQLYPDRQDIIELQSFYKDALNIESREDIIKFQNHVLDSIHHEPLSVKESILTNVIRSKKGLCYDRSILMQKVMLINDIEVRPVFLFCDTSRKKTIIWDIFDKELLTHNIFEFKLGDKWYVMKTNRKMSDFTSLEEYIHGQKMFNGIPMYIRHLNNRHGRFIPPAYIPDIY